MGDDFPHWPSPSFSLLLLLSQFTLWSTFYHIGVGVSFCFCCVSKIYYFPFLPTDSNPYGSNYPYLSLYSRKIAHSSPLLIPRFLNAIIHLRFSLPSMLLFPIVDHCVLLSIFSNPFGSSTRLVLLLSLYSRTIRQGS